MGKGCSRVQTSPEITPRSLTARPWKMVVGRLLSYWEGNFSGAMLKLREGISRYHLPWISIVCTHWMNDFWKDVWAHWATQASNGSWHCTSWSCWKSVNCKRMTLAAMPPSAPVPRVPRFTLGKPSGKRQLHKATNLPGKYCQTAAIWVWHTIHT